jgi:hypothetical protein
MSHVTAKLAKLNVKEKPFTLVEYHPKPKLRRINYLFQFFFGMALAAKSAHRVKPADDTGC